MITRPRWHPVVDVAAMALACVLALVPLSAAFADVRFWLAAAGGVLVGVGVAVLGARLRAGVLELTGLAVFGYFAFGGLFAIRESAILGIVPGLETLRGLALAVVFGWKQLLTVSTPVSGFPQLFAMPYLAGLLAAVLAASLALRLRRGHPFALLPVLALVVFAISFGDYRAPLPELVGSALAAVGLGWIAWRTHSDRAGRTSAVQPASEKTRQAALRRAAVGCTTLLLATAVGATAIATATSAWDRTVLREQVIPPQELHAFASPLMSFRKLVTDGKDTTLFTVTGLPAGGVIRVASLDLYDGIVYKVSGAGGPGSGVFSRMGRTVADSGEGHPATLQVSVKDWRGVWLPDAGSLSAVTFGGPRADALTAGLNYNPETDTALVTGGLTEGDSYTLQTRIAAVPTADQLLKARVEQITTPVPEMIPDAIQDRLDEAITGVETPIKQLQAIEAYLHQKGFFSHGLASDPVKSRSGHTYERLTSMLEQSQMVGDDEQYAVVMALMAAEVGIPARVVMGFAPTQVNADGETAVTGADVHAWVEVPLQGYGWVAFHPTPPEDQQLKERTPQARQKPRLQVPQPPLPPQEPAELPPQPPDPDQGDETLPPDFSWVWRLLLVSGIALGSLTVVFGPGLAMLWVKARRRVRRRGAARLPDAFSGGWDEIVDAAADVGTPVGAAATRREHAAELAGRYPDLALSQLADRADVAVFGAGEPAPPAVAGYWDDVETARRRISAAAPLGQRLRQFFAPASVLGKHRRRKVGRQ